VRLRASVTHTLEVAVAWMPTATQREGKFMGARNGVAGQRLAISSSSAGVPRTYRTLRTKHGGMKLFLSEAASRCGRFLKSVIVATRPLRF
jgi:hypothetical protein